MTSQDLLDEAKRLEDKRAQDMPTAQDAIDAMYGAHQRLVELGWKDAMYCPKDGSTFQVIEPGGTGVHDAVYLGEWPNGSIFLPANGDLWPSRPCLFYVRKPE